MRSPTSIDPYYKNGQVDLFIRDDMTDKKISLFCHNLEINGANIFLLTLAKVLQQHGNIIVLSPRDGRMRKRFEMYGFKTFLINEDYQFDDLHLFDMVFINSLMMSRVVLECVQRNVIHVLIVHETWVPERINYYLNDLWNIEGVSADDVFSALKTSHNVVFPAKFLETIYQSLVHKDRCKTIYCTIEMDRIDNYLSKNKRSSIREKLGIEQDDIVFIQIGTITRRKAQMNTLEAFHKAYKELNQKKKLILLFVGARSFRRGENEYVNEIKLRISEYDLASAVRIYEVQEDIYRFLMASDIMVHPSINEVLPLVVLEGCYFNLPVIVSNLDGMPEVIRHQKEGLLVNPFDIISIANAMCILAEDSNEREKLGKNARKRIMTQHAVTDFERIYSHLVQCILQ